MLRTSFKWKNYVTDTFYEILLFFLLFSRWYDSSLLNASCLFASVYLWNCLVFWVEATLWQTEQCITEFQRSLTQRRQLDRISRTSQPQWCCHRGNEMSCEYQRASNVNVDFVFNQLLPVVTFYLVELSPLTTKQQLLKKRWWRFIRNNAHQTASKF